eukprot:1351192-Pleurochrysis_carterae.AAC.2
MRGGVRISRAGVRALERRVTRAPSRWHARRRSSHRRAQCPSGAGAARSCPCMSSTPAPRPPHARKCRPLRHLGRMPKRLMASCTGHKKAQRRRGAS